MADGGAIAYAGSVAAKKADMPGRLADVAAREAKTERKPKPRAQRLGTAAKKARDAFVEKALVQIEKGSLDVVSDSMGSPTYALFRKVRESDELMRALKNGMIGRTAKGERLRRLCRAYGFVRLATENPVLLQKAWTRFAPHRRTKPRTAAELMLDACKRAKAIGRTAPKKLGDVLSLLDRSSRDLLPGSAAARAEIGELKLETILASGDLMQLVYAASELMQALQGAAGRSDLSEREDAAAEDPGLRERLRRLRAEREVASLFREDDCGHSVAMKLEKIAALPPLDLDDGWTDRDALVEFLTDDEMSPADPTGVSLVSMLLGNTGNLVAECTPSEVQKKELALLQGSIKKMAKILENERD